MFYIAFGGRDVRRVGAECIQRKAAFDEIVTIKQCTTQFTPAHVGRQNVHQMHKMNFVRSPLAFTRATHSFLLLFAA